MRFLRIMLEYIWFQRINEATGIEDSEITNF
jgi:hypothetical protein